MNSSTAPAAESGFFPAEQKKTILEHMNEDHADAVLRYAKHYAGRKEATAGRLVDIDRDGIDIAIQTPAGEASVRVAFAQPLEKADDAHVVLVTMAKTARQAESIARGREAVAQLREFKTILLGTADRTGLPDASVAPAVIGPDGAFHVYVSALSIHTRNLVDTQKASVLVIEDEADAAQLLARRRLTFPCTASPVPRDAAEFTPIMTQLKTKFGAVMTHLETMTDFQLIRLVPARGRLVAGFGQAFDVDPIDWNQLSHVGGGGHGHGQGHGHTSAKKD